MTRLAARQKRSWHAASGLEILTIAVGSTLTGAALTDVQALQVLSATVGASLLPASSRSRSFP